MVVLAALGPARADDCNNNGIPDDVDITNGTSPDCNGNGVPDECDILGYPSAAGLTLWLRADLGVTDDPNGVSLWGDQSGLNNDYLPVTGYGRPALVAGVLNQQSVVRFDGSDDLLHNSGHLITGSQFTIFTVLSVVAGNYPWEFGDGSDQRRVFYERGTYGGGSPDTLDIGHDWGNDARATYPGISSSGFRVISIICDQVLSGTQVYVDGDAASVSLTGSDLQWVVGGGENSFPLVNYSPPGMTAMDVAEFLIYERVLLADERQAVENYLAHKYFGAMLLADCNENGIPDECDIAGGNSEDCDSNNIPDECQPDCQPNGVPDACDILFGASGDVNANGVPDECETDCQPNGLPDAWEIAQGLAADCNANAIPDDCDVSSGSSDDVDANGVPDECQPDCQPNGIPDSWEVGQGLAPDCNGNGVPDACDLAGGTSRDCNHNGVPEECEQLPGTSRLYVDIGAIGAHSGLSWADALTDLEDALCLADADPAVQEIWVAAGAYRPTARTNPGDPRSATFQLVSGLALYGGFAGWETSLDQRDIVANETILSGDLAGNDDPNQPFTNYEDNAYHVLVGTGSDSSAVLSGFVIRGGNATGDCGGGLINEPGHPTVTDCVFLYNAARTYGGGAVYNNAGAHPTFVRCVFRRNVNSGTADGISAARYVDCVWELNYDYGIRDVGGALLIVNGIVRGNEGGIAVNNGSPVLVNCLVVGNTADAFNCVIHTVGPPVLVNCTFSGNGNGYLGPGTLTNCVIWGNAGTGADGPTVRYSCVQGLSGGSNGNVGADPLLARLPDAGADETWGTADDDYGDLRLQAGSPCADAGDNTALPADSMDIDQDGDVLEPLPYDLGGNLRISDDPVAAPNGGPLLIDMGAFEDPQQAILVQPLFLDVPEGGTAVFQVRPALPPTTPVQIVTTITDGDPDLEIAVGETLTFDNASYLVAQPVVIRALEDPDFANGTAHATMQMPGVRGVLVTVREADNEFAAARLFVDSAAPPGGDGTAWPSALSSLEDALYLVGATGNAVQEIWVAAGAYRPTARTNPGDPRSATFQLVSGLALYGGFAGWETSLDQRDIVANETILSGDLAGNDDPNQPFTNYEDNAYHVLVGTGSDSSAVLSGFVIRGGNATGDCGGGLINEPGHPTVTDCVFLYNTARTWGGGGVYNNAGAQPTFLRCVFRRNINSGTSDGISSARYVDCVWELNYDYGIRDVGGALLIVNGIVRGNEGGILVNNGSPVLVNCLVVGNTADAFNCVIHTVGPPALVNCTFSGNGNGYLGPGTLTNCVIWGNAGTGADGPTVTYSCVQGLSGGSNGNIGADPLLARLPDAGADETWGTADDDYGDLRLQAGSACIDAGQNEPDGEPVIGIDLDGNLRRADEPNTPDCQWAPGTCGTPPIVDMGAYEFGSAPIPQRLYVNGAATGAKTGVDWDGAFDLLRVAWKTAAVAGSRVNELWVAAGTYTPDSANGDRRESFQLLNGLAVHGGFVGTENDISERDSNNPASETILSGDLNSNDDPNDTGTLVDNCYHVVDARGANYLALLDGFTIRGGNADGAAPNDVGGGLYASGGGPFLVNCRLVNNSAGGQGGGVYSAPSRPVLDSVTIDQNTCAVGNGGVIDNGCLYLQGPLMLTGGTSAAPVTLEIRSSQFEGPGGLDIDANTVFRVAAGPSYDPVIIRTPVSGTGKIVIDLGQQLTLDGAAVDLGGEAGGGCADPNNAPNWGAIEINGALLAHDATIQNTNLAVRLATVGGTLIYNNQINLLELGTGYGGEFFVQGTSTIQCNVIYAEGDRYLDLDPDPGIPPDQRPSIGGGEWRNKFYVTIKQGVEGEQGELLELRTLDFNCDIGGGYSGAYQLDALPGGAGYADAWALEHLEVQTGAKVNLTNRPGFVFQDPGEPDPEALYVKELVLHPGAVLNTGLQRMYYQSLVDELGQPLVPDPNDPSLPLANGSRIVDVPILGFSLKVIGMEDATELAVRVRTRLRDPFDDQPSAPPFREGWIGSVAVPLPEIPDNHALQVLTQAPDALPASSVAAHGAFARAGDENITVAFQYRFIQNPAAELVVYLSDLPEPRDPAAPDPLHQVEVARVYPPAAGRAGALDSSEFATFYATFPRGGLNFTRGTYVELELRGEVAEVWIDDWDPQILCLACADLNGTATVDRGDYLLALAEQGQALDPSDPEFDYNRTCLDNGLSGDNYVGLNDLLAWDLFLSGQSLNACDTGLDYGSKGRGGGTPVALPPGTQLLLAGKPCGAGLQEDYLYTLDSTGACTGAAPLRPASAPHSTAGYRANGRLIRDGGGQLYQVHALQGLVRLNDAAVVLAPQQVTAPTGDTVYVGVNVEGDHFRGVPLEDAAFDPVDPNKVYVVPVVVDPADGDPPYKAAARLQLLGSGAYAVQTLYGRDPADDPRVTVVFDPFGRQVYEPDFQRLREIEVDADGNVFVAAANALNENDWVLLYTASGNESGGVLFGQGAPAGFAALDLPLNGPTALRVSAANPDKLYLARSVEPVPDGRVRLFRFTIVSSAGVATGLAYDGAVEISNPTVALPPGYGAHGYTGIVSALEEDPANGTLWVVTCTQARFAPDQSPTAPVFDPDSGMIFTVPALAVIPSSSSWLPEPPAQPAITATMLDCHTLALPVSAAWVTCGPEGLRGDLNCDGVVGFGDINPFVLYLSNYATWQAMYPNCPPENGDINGDGSYPSFADINPFVALLTGTR